MFEKLTSTSIFDPTATIFSEGIRKGRCDGTKFGSRQGGFVPKSGTARCGHNERKRREFSAARIAGTNPEQSTSKERAWTFRRTSWPGESF